MAHAWTGEGFAFDDALHGQIDGAVERVLRLAAAFAASSSPALPA